MIKFYEVFEPVNGKFIPRGPDLLRWIASYIDRTPEHKGLVFKGQKSRTVAKLVDIRKPANGKQNLLEKPAREKLAAELDYYLLKTARLNVRYKIEVE